jgi:hypothetical protein
LRKVIIFAAGDAPGDDSLQHRGFRKVEMKRGFRPFDDDELERGAGTPEQGGDGQ